MMIEQYSKTFLFSIVGVIRQKSVIISTIAEKHRVETMTNNITVILDAKMKGASKRSISYKRICSDVSGT